MDSYVIMHSPGNYARNPPALASLHSHLSAQGLFPAKYFYGLFLPEKEWKDMGNQSPHNELSIKKSYILL